MNLAYILILALARHLLTLSGGWFLAHGYFTEQDYIQWLGAGMATVPTIWSAVTHIKLKRKITDLQEKGVSK